VLVFLIYNICDQLIFGQIIFAQNPPGQIMCYFFMNQKHHKKYLQNLYLVGV